MKPFCLSLTFLLLTACAHRSEQQQAQDLVREYLQKELPDPGSYEPGAFEVAGYSRADSARGMMRHSMTEAAGVTDASSISVEEVRQLAARAKSGVAQSGSLRNYMGDTTRVGWRVTHDYRAKNKVNALTKYRQTFIVYPRKKLLVALEE